jgi:hypothetical protein
MIQIPAESPLKAPGMAEPEAKDDTVEADGCTAYLAYFEEAEAFKTALQQLQRDVASGSQEPLDRQLLWISLTVIRSVRVVDICPTDIKYDRLTSTKKPRSSLTRIWSS